MGEVDVIVVGAGISGLSAARWLNQQSLKVTVFEATDRVGGKVMSKPPRAGESPSDFSELGGAWISYSQVHAIRMCKELGLKTCENVYESLTSVQYQKGNIYKFIDLKSDLWWSHPLAAWDLQLMVLLLEQMCWEVPVDRPWDAPRAKEWDQMTVKDFFDKHCWTSYCRQYLTRVVSTMVGGDPVNISLLFYLWSLRHEEGPMRAWGWCEEDVGLQIAGGSHQLADRMARDLEKSVVLNQPVVKIKHGSNDVTVQTLSGAKYKAKYVILATAATTQMKIHFEPGLSVMRSSLLQRSPIGLVMKCAVYYLEKFWEKNGLCGSAMCMSGMEVVGGVVADYKPGTKLFGLVCFVYREHINHLDAMTDLEKERAVCESLAKYFQSDQALKPVKFDYKMWSDESYMGGAYMCHYPPGALTLFGPALRAPIGSRVFLAGTETATHYVGNISGAIDAGQRAAREVLHAEGLIDASEVWVQEPSSRYQPTRVEQLLPSIERMVTIFAATLAMIAALVFYG